MLLLLLECRGSGGTRKGESRKQDITKEKAPAWLGSPRLHSTRLSRRLLHNPVEIIKVQTAFLRRLQSDHNVDSFAVASVQLERDRARQARQGPWASKTALFVELTTQEKAERPLRVARTQNLEQWSTIRNRC